jgi:ankyrin repeat protein
MPTRDLPSRPNLTQLKLQAKELLQAQRARQPAAAGRILGHHPKLTGQSLQAVLDYPLTLADAQLVIAREHGLPSWAKLKERLDMVRRIGDYTPHPRFADALAALDAGDVERLRGLLALHPELVHARTNLDPRHGYFTAATLLHHVAGNPGRDTNLPPNISDVARVLLEAGADVDAETLGPSGGTTMGLLLTSKHASDMGVTGPLVDLLLQHGATLDPQQPGALHASLANHAPRAAEKLIELGAQPDVFAAAALGRMDLLYALFDHDGRLRSRPRRHGKVMSERDAIGLAALYAYVRHQPAALDFLLDKDGNWNMTGVNNGTLLHRAAWNGDIPLIERLLRSGADPHNRDNPFHSTPLSWAQHAKQDETFQWLRANSAVDLHDAVCFDLREHVSARLREDPAAVNRRIDQWEIPQCTPLHWAAWLYVEDVHGRHPHDPAARQELVKLLLEHGADLNIVAGNGCTPLDIADACEASGIVALLQQHGGKRAGEL